jgi:GTP-binding protein LepA
VIVLVRVIDGTLRAGQRIRMMQQGSTHLIDRIGVFRPSAPRSEELGPGEIGFITAQIKEVAHAAVGDTITDERKPAAQALPGFREVQSVVFCGLFPGGRGQVRGPARRHRPPAPERRQLHLRDGDQRRARLRLPLRVPRALLHLEIIQERLSASSTST